MRQTLLRIADRCDGSRLVAFLDGDTDAQTMVVADPLASLDAPSSRVHA